MEEEGKGQSRLGLAILLLLLPSKYKQCCSVLHFNSWHSYLSAILSIYLFTVYLSTRI